MSAKQNILNKLRKSLTGTTPVPDNFDEVLVTEPWTYTPEQRIPQLRKLMEAVHTEIPQYRARLACIARATGHRPSVAKPADRTDYSARAKGQRTLGTKPRVAST